MTSVHRLRRLLAGCAAVALVVQPAQSWAAGAAQGRARAAFADCQGCTVQDANFAGVDLSGLRLDGAQLVDVDLTGANLSGVRFEGVTLVRVKLDHANLTRARFDGANASETSFRGAALVGTTFQGVTFDRNVFTGARMREAGVYGSQLIASDLRDTDLTGANIASSNLARSDLRGTTVSRAVLCERVNENTNGPNGSTRHARVTRCVGLEGADVQGVQFEGSLSCDADRCIRLDPKLLREPSDGAA